MQMEASAASSQRRLAGQRLFLAWPTQLFHWGPSLLFRSVAPNCLFVSIGQAVTVGDSQVGTIPLTSVNGGANTNLDQGDPIQLQTSVSGVLGLGTIVTMSGGSDSEETDGELLRQVTAAAFEAFHGW